MDLNQIESFVWVAELGSSTRAEPPQCLSHSDRHRTGPLSLQTANRAGGGWAKRHSGTGWRSLGFAVLPPHTLSNFQTPHTFTTHKLRSPQRVCELMLFTSARRLSTETHKGVQALVADVVETAIEGYS